MKSLSAVRTAAGMLAVLIGLVGCGGQRDNAGDPGSGGRLTIATGNTTGVYYILGGGLANVISKNLPGYKATAEATKASKENIERVASGQNDIGFALADTAADATSGRNSFTSKQPVKALMRIYDNTTQVIVRADSGITSIAGMKGKSVSTGSPNSGTELIATRLLAANALTPGDVSQKKASLPETVDGMKDGSIQAMFWSGGLPTAGVKDLVAALGDKVRFLDLTAELPTLQAKYGDAYQPGTIPASAYGTKADVSTIVVANVLVVHTTMSDDLAGRLVRLIFDKKGELEKVHPEARNITLERAAKTGEIPLHPGSEKGLKELGAPS
ncbi:MAG TPA: TAXI family TRAP transporter solute-binding subunit [Cryptosporangiaceae bacterium]|nr:TAXI family TRAP transporter solute-binding subunit [Cryptosporangiaceae bacterium]